MNRLEDELKNCLKRKEPPAEFTDRLLKRISAPPSPRPDGWQKLLSLFAPPKIRWVSASVLACLLVAFGVSQYRSYQRVRAEGELAKTQLILGLQIAGNKLNFAQKKVLEIHDYKPLPERTGSQ
jgi:hypothetical protein